MCQFKFILCDKYKPLPQTYIDLKFLINLIAIKELHLSELEKSIYIICIAAETTFPNESTQKNIFFHLKFHSLKH